MTTTDQKREWLAGQGYEVPARGRLSKTLQDAWDTGHPDGEAIPGDDGEAIPGDDGGVTDADFSAGDEVTAVTPETRPRKPRGGGAGRPGGLLGGLLGGKAGKTGTVKKKKRPRVPLDKFVSRLYTRGGQMISTMAPATGRCLQAQSAMAGVILEDIARDTIADRFLQPAARAEDKLDKVFALTAPPLLVLALEVTEPRNMMRRVMLTGMLRESLLISMDITSAYAGRIEEQARRAKENEEAVDKLIGFIFAEAPAEPEMAGAAA